MENFSTSSESPIISGIKVKEDNKLLKLIEKLNINFIDGCWVQGKNVTKKGSRIFIKQLNSCTSYHKREKNHTFTNLVYIPEAGFTIIQFLNEKLASQFIYERQGVNWQNQTDSDSESESDSNEDEDRKKSQNLQNCKNGQSEDLFCEEFEESDEEEFEEDEESHENEDEDDQKGNGELVCLCEIRKIELDQDKFVGILKNNLKSIKSRKKYCYFFVFKDTENAENYFKEVYFNLKNSIFY